MIDYLTVLDDKGPRFIDVVARADLDAPVPCCPDWAVRDLAGHLGRVWEWARSCVEASAYVEKREEAVPDDALAAWLQDIHRSLVTVLGDSDPAAPTWHFGPKPRTVGFWHRRQAQETTVHLWDAQTALGVPEPIDDALARDGIDEVFTVMLPRQVRLERMTAVADGVRIALPGGPAYDLGDRIAAEISGSPSDLLLALWRRLPLDALEVHGDKDIARLAFDRALTP
ncbi:MAG: maleylpyruvate isomerase family mycothiol-dependent enzyme [Actinomycetales bacterium]|nr:maleylpyruvate isomerase family mycothiol-dependent enzyme [Actinomycetales bacterium]